MGYNRAILMGRLTKDPELKTVNDSSKVANFTLAVDVNYRDAEGNRTPADFIPISAWGKKAEFVARYFKKGKQVLVSGPVKTYSYEKDGTKFYGFNINATEVDFADSAGAVNSQNENSEDDFPVDDDFMNQPSGFDDDDLPF